VTPDETDLKIGYHIAAWINLLGQSQRLEYLDAASMTEDSEKRIEAARIALHPYGRFRQVITSVAEQMRLPPRDYPVGTIESIPKDRYEAIKKLTTSNIARRFIGDSALLTLRADDKVAAPIFSLYVMLGQLSVYMLSLLAEKIPVRGAVAGGWCLVPEANEGEVYGAAISRSYHCEAKLAEYPRIVIHPTVIKFINDHRSMPNDPKVAGCIQSIIEEIEKSIELDDDGVAILSYLPDRAGAEPLEPEMKAVMKQASAFINQSIAQFTKGNQYKLYQRYFRLRRYFERHNCWFPDEITQ